MFDKIDKSLRPAIIIMKTSKESNTKTCYRKLDGLKGNIEDSSGVIRELPVTESTLSSPLSKGKRTRFLTRLPESSKNNSPECDQERRRTRENVRKTKPRQGQKNRVSETHKKLRLKQQQSSFKRRLWTTEEDRAITLLVQQHGIRKWTLISRKLQEKYHIHSRSGKQCRER